MRNSDTGRSGINAKSNDSQSVAILDFLFTFSLATGLLPEAIGENRQGIFSAHWVQNHSLPSWVELGEFLTLLFGVFMLTFSWYGYHDSIRRWPHRPTTFQGFIRFQIDVFLILLYGALILSMNNIENALFLGGLIYLLYWVWDLLVAYEYSDDELASTDHSFLFWPIAFFGGYVVARVEPISPVFFALIAIILSVWYRQRKVNQSGRQNTVTKTLPT